MTGPGDQKINLRSLPAPALQCHVPRAFVHRLWIRVGLCHGNPWVYGIHFLSPYNLIRGAEPELLPAISLPR